MLLKQKNTWSTFIPKITPNDAEELKKSGKGHANIGIACSGGQHRSVAIAQYLFEFYSKKYETSVSHRDIEKK